MTLDAIKQAIAETRIWETTLGDYLHSRIYPNADPLLTEAARRVAALPITDEMVEAGARSLFLTDLFGPDYSEGDYASERSECWTVLPNEAFDPDQHEEVNPFQVRYFKSEEDDYIAHGKIHYRILSRAALEAARAVAMGGEL